MATKIDIDNISKAMVNAKAADINLKLVITNGKSKSDKKTDNKFSSTLEHGPELAKAIYLFGEETIKARLK